MELEVVFVEPSEQDGAEVERPDAVVDFFQADVVLDDAGADVDPPLLPADAAVAADASDFEVAGIFQRREPLGIGARGRLIEGSRGLVLEPLVWPLVVELVAEGVEETLLGSGVGGGRASRLGLEGSVHPFVAAVLLGVEGWISSGRMPRRIHQTESLESRLIAVAQEKGLPLSVRIASGSP